MSTAFEVNFDGLVGPTHGYSGLSFGNIASTNHRAAESSPREAALQGLKKMKQLADLGFKQAVFPPQERPSVGALKALGFRGKDHEIIARAAAEVPEIYAACCSASSMWTANAGTVAPSADSSDGRVHFTAANLAAKFHRSIEPAATSKMFRAIFHDKSSFAHHEPLPAGPYFGDEGAANHIRFCSEHGKPGLQVFVYGRKAFGEPGPEPKKFPARQSLEASQAIARLHGLHADRVAFVQQNPELIDAGVFHNDVASVGNGNVLFYHEQAFVGGARTIDALSKQVERTCGLPFVGVRVGTEQVSVDDAVKSYLFNTQLLSDVKKDRMVLIAPSECQETPSVKAYLEELVAGAKTPIRRVHYFNLRESMRNGGGPACLRLRVVLTPAEIKKIEARVFLDQSLYDDLCAWVKKHYRERLVAGDLSDPRLLDESRTALDELTELMKLGSIYPFQS